MTMPYGSTEEPMEIVSAHQSVPIHVASSSLKPGKPIGTEFGRVRTFIVANVVQPTSTTPGAQRVLNRSQRRYEARIVVLGNGVSTAGTPVVAQATAAATGNATATLPNGASITGFAITPGTAAAGYTAAITVTGANGGSNPINYALQGSATVAQPLSVTYPNPLTPISPTTGIAVVFTGNANTPSADIVVYGIIPASGTNGSNDGVIIGSATELQSGMPAVIGSLAGFLPIGANYVYKSQSELWVAYPVSNSGSVFVTVTDYQWASEPDSYREAKGSERE